MLDLATTNVIVSHGTLLLLLGSLGIVAALAMPKLISEQVNTLFSRHGMWFAFALATLATAITLYYSEVLGEAPCSWCWVQRAMLWPQVIILFIAALAKDRSAALYAIGLSAVGAVVALYHHWLQMGGSAFFPCPADGPGPACEIPTFVTWGFVTFPFMAFALFLFILLFMTYLRTTWRKYPPA